MFRLLLIAASWLSPAGDTNACVLYWQHELGLDSWTIITKVIPDQELGGTTLGTIDIDASARTAVVQLMRVEDSDLPRRLARAEQKFTIAHELMHLRLYVDKDPNWRDDALVDAVTISLVRKKKRWNELIAVESQSPAMLKGRTPLSTP